MDGAAAPRRKGGVDAAQQGQGPVAQTRVICQWVIVETPLSRRAPGGDARWAAQHGVTPILPQLPEMATDRGEK